MITHPNKYEGAPSSILHSLLNVKAIGLIIISVGLVIRLIGLIFYGLNELKFGDARDYLLAANSFCNYQSYPQATELPFFRPPGLPLFLAIFSLCNLEYIPLLKFLIVLSDMAGLWGCLKLLTAVAASDNQKIMAAVLYSFSPFLIGQTFDIQSEPLFQACLIWSVFLLTKNKPLWGILSGSMLAFSALVRPISLGYLPLYLLSFYFFKQSNWRTGILLFLIGFSLTLLPWSIYNWRRTGEVILINDAFGYNFWRGNHPIMQEIYDAKSKEELSRLSSILEHQLTPITVSEIDKTTLVGRSKAFFQRGISIVRENPIAWLKLMATKIAVYFKPWLSVSVYDWRIQLIVGAWEIFLYFGFLFGLRSLFQVDPRIAVFIIFFILLGCFLQLPFQVVARFKIPNLEWILILMTAFGLKLSKSSISAATR